MNSFPGALDFECTVVSPDEKNARNTPRMKTEAQFNPVSFSMIFISKDGKVVHKVYRASQDHCMKYFFKEIDKAQRKLEPLLQRFPKHNLSPAEVRRRKEAASVCYLCNQPFPFSLEEDREIYVKNARRGAAGRKEKKKKEGPGPKEHDESEATLRKRVGQTRVIDHSVRST